MLESCRDPDLVTEITLQPVRRHGVDAAIFFSDIVVPLRRGRGGPRHRARRRAGGRRARAHARRPRPAARARPRSTSRTSPRPCGCSSPSWATTPLIGFAGAPFTLASYLVEGGPSQEPRAHQGADVRRPAAVARPVRPAGRRSPARSCGCRSRPARPRCSCSTRGSAPCRGPTTSAFVQPHSAAALAAVADLDVPRIHFGVGHRRAARVHGRGRRRGRRRRLPGLAHRRHRAASGPVRRAGQPRPGPALRAVGGAGGQGRARSWTRAARRRATSSTSATACCRDTDPDVLTRVVELVHEASSRTS